MADLLCLICDLIKLINDNNSFNIGFILRTRWKFIECTFEFFACFYSYDITIDILKIKRFFISYIIQNYTLSSL